MRKILAVIAMSALFAGAVMAGMDDVTISVADLKPAYTQTNSFTIRGEIKMVEVYCHTPQATVSGTVTLVSGGNTFFSKACTGAVTRAYPNVQITDYAGTGLFDSSVTNTDSIVITNKLYAPYPVAGVVTSTIAGLGPNTNDYTIKIVYWK